MEQLIELLKQIQELAGVAIDALEGAAGGGEGGPEGGGEAPAPQGEGGGGEAPEEMPPGQ
jgi:hypothetical protein